MDIEAIMGFLLQQIDQKVVDLEEKSFHQRSIIKAIKKDKKLADLITKPANKLVPFEEPPVEKSMTLQMKEYVRSQYPENLGYLDEENFAAYEKKKSDEYCMPYAEMSQLASKSVLDLFAGSQTPSGYDSGRYRHQDTVKASLFRGRTEDLGEELHSNYSGGDTMKNLFYKKAIMRTRSVNDDNYADSTREQNNVSPYDSQSSQQLPRGGVVSTKNILKHFRGGSIEYKVR